MIHFLYGRATVMVQHIKTSASPNRLSLILELTWLKERMDCPLTSMYMVLHTEAKLKTNDACGTGFLTLLKLYSILLCMNFFVLFKKKHSKMIPELNSDMIAL